jgi:hypothetical protein
MNAGIGFGVDRPAGYGQGVWKEWLGPWSEPILLRRLH